MIQFDREEWWVPVFVWHGGVLHSCALTVTLYVCYCTGVYHLMTHYDLSREFSFHHSALAGFVSFLYIFRLNQCHHRYMTGKALTADLFSELKSLLSSYCTTLNGDTVDRCLGWDLHLDAFKFTNVKRSSSTLEKLGLEKIDERKEEEELNQRILAHRNLAAAAKVNMTRLIIAFAVSFKLHCMFLDAFCSRLGRLEDEVLDLALFNLARVRALLYADERHWLDKILQVYTLDGGEVSMESNPYQEERKPHLVDYNRHRPNSMTQGRSHVLHNRTIGDASPTSFPVYFAQLMRLCLKLPLSKPWGYPERMLNVCDGYVARIMTAVEHLDQLITMPLPLPYLQHCRILLLIYAATLPTNIHMGTGCAANVFQCTCAFFALIGFDIVAQNLENPLGDDDTDLNTMEMIHELEVAANNIFQMSELGSSDLLLAQRQTLEVFDMKDTLEKLRPGIPSDNPRTHEFEAYFSWVTLPDGIMEYIETRCGHTNAILPTRGFNLLVRCWRCLVSCCCRRSSARIPGGVYKAMHGPSEVANSRRGSFQDGKEDHTLMRFYLVLNTMRFHPPVEDTPAHDGYMAHRLDPDELASACSGSSDIKPSTAPPEVRLKHAWSSNGLGPF